MSFNDLMAFAAAVALIVLIGIVVAAARQSAIEEHDQYVAKQNRPR
jgi:hypothetical protein